MAAREFQADRERNTLQQAVTPWYPPAPSIGQRGEHIVHHDVPRQLMVKQTHGGRYGYTVDQGPDANQRRLTVRTAIPSEYLRRQGLMKVAFGDQLSLVAIVTDPYHKSDPAIVIEQTHVNGTHDATDASITAFMQSAGFTRLDDRLIDTHELPDGVWYRSSDHLLVADANASNFVRLLNSEQIIPIDLVVTQHPPELIAEIEKLTAQGTPSLAKASTSPHLPISPSPHLPVSQSPSPLARLGWNHLDRATTPSQNESIRGFDTLLQSHIYAPGNTRTNDRDRAQSAATFLKEGISSRASEEASPGNRRPWRPTAATQAEWQRLNQDTGPSSVGRNTEEQALVEWAAENGLLFKTLPAQWKFYGPDDVGMMKHHVFWADDKLRWIKITSSGSYGIQPFASGDGYANGSPCAD